MPTDAERLNRLEELVARLEAAIGDLDNRPDLDNPPAELPNRQYPLMFSEYQLHVALNSMGPKVETLRTKVAALEARPTGSVQPGPATGGAILPLVKGKSVGLRTGIVNTRPPVSRVYSEGEFELPNPEIHTRPQAFMGPVAFGGVPIESDQKVQIRSGGEVLFLTKVPSADTQEKNGDKLRSGVVSFNPYDNGVRLIRGGFWRNGLLNRTESVIHILGIDSAGWVSKSVEDYTKPTVEHSQLWVVTEDFTRRVISISAMRAGWGVVVNGTTNTANYANPAPNFDREAMLVEPLAP